jgi:predicted ATPase/DNA-binding winged helix-turn-helix (wHTH) protein
MERKPEAAPTIYSIGPFRLDLASQALTRLGVPEALGPRALAVLATIISRAPLPVPKATIIREAWPGLVVEENNLTVQIAAIRRTLAQVPGGDRWVETIARRGYRFVGPVMPLPASATPGEKSPGNVPLALTSFVGRERELVELKSLLSKNRLLSLVGAGGIGKTRLAMQLGAEVPDAYGDGVWFADLVPVSDAALLASAVAQALSVPHASGGALVQAVAQHCRGRRLLLILDNCEHMLDAAATFVDSLLRSAADLTVIATSREPLCVEGEQVYRLSPLSLPNAAAELAELRRSESVLLFVDRAQHQMADFALTAERAPAVADLCRRLDGIPLALELAAARLGALSVEEISSRLHDRFALLVEGSRTPDYRHRTLKATFDWSHDLLSEAERKVLRRIAIFAGGFTIDGAAAVAADSAVNGDAIAAIVSHLVSHYLFFADTSEGLTRLGFLDTMRAYSLEMLERAHESEAMRCLHAAYVRDRFEQAASEFLVISDAEWRARYVPDIANVRAALDWSLGSGGDPSLAVTLAGASAPLWTKVSLYGEGLERLTAAVARMPESAAMADQARLWLWFGLLVRHADPPQSLAAYERAVALYRKCARPRDLGVSLARLAHALVNLGRLGQAATALAEALPLLEADDNPKALGIFSGAAGYLAFMRGDATDALKHFERASARFREAQDEPNVVETLINIADIRWQLGDLRGAESSLRDFIAMRSRPFVRRSRLANAFALLVGVLSDQGAFSDALEAARESVRLMEQDAGNDAWNVMDYFALRAAYAGNLANAARITGYADACFLAKQASREPNEARTRASLQALLCERLAPSELENLLHEGARLSEREACRLAVDS